MVTFISWYFYPELRLPTLFIAVTDDDMEVISLCHQSGEIILEQVGTLKRKVLAASLCEFLDG